MSISGKWRQIPGPVRLFVLKALALFVAWKLLYLTLLLPGRTLDKPLTYAISAGTAAVLNGFDHSKAYHISEGLNLKPGGDGRPFREAVMDIFWRQDRMLSIADVCNGLELMVLYAGLILCLPAAPRRKLLFILPGMLLIEVLNIIRCTGLVLIYRHRPGYLDFSHHYLFSFLVYGFIFWLWYLFSKEPRFAEKLKLNVST